MSDSIRVYSQFKNRACDLPLNFQVDSAYHGKTMVCDTQIPDYDSENRATFIKSQPRSERRLEAKTYVSDFRNKAYVNWLST